MCVRHWAFRVWAWGWNRLQWLHLQKSGGSALRGRGEGGGSSRVVARVVFAGAVSAS